jgi:poly(A) polymerase
LVVTVFTPSERLEPADHPWLTAPATQAVMQALEAKRPGSACFVGGCVRNAVRAATVDDIDIASALFPQEVMEALEASGLKAVPTGLDHGTVTAVAHGQPFEITSLRADVETYGRHARVAFTRDWDQDWRRRDFTMNALYADREGMIYDPTGSGLADAREGRVRFIGHAPTRIAEDYLRILRFFRFFAWYGEGRPPAEDLKACRQGREGLKDLSAERVAKELLRLLASPDPRPAVDAMAETGLWQALSLDPIRQEGLNALVRFEAVSGEQGEATLRLAALAGDKATGEAWAARLKLSKAQEGRLSRALDLPVPGPSPEDQRRFLAHEGAQALADRARLAAATGALSDEAARRALSLSQARLPDFPLSGRDVIQAGVAPGPAVGEILSALKTCWADAGFPESAERLKPDLHGLVERYTDRGTRTRS